MLKKVNYVYVIFILFVFFILYSFYFILNTNKNTKNNYLTIEKIEMLNLLDKKFDNLLSKKLQYININEISKDIATFNIELHLLKTMLHNENIHSDLSPHIKKLHQDFINKQNLMKEFKNHNSLLVNSIQTLLNIQSNIQKRYYFSPIGLEVNSIIVNFTQSALGQNKYISYINQNIKNLKDLRILYKLADKQLNQFIDNSHLTLRYLNNLNDVVNKKNNIHLDKSINSLKKFLIRYFKKLSKKEETFSYILIFIIISFLLALIITYRIDKKHKLELLRFRKAVENSDNNVMITDVNKNITYVNNSFEKTTGYTKKEVYGQNPKILKSNVLEKDFYSNLHATLDGLHSWDGEFINRKKNGDIYYEKASIVPIVLDNKLNGFLAIKLDITNYIKQKNDLLEQASKLKEAQKFAHLGSWEVNRLDGKVYFSEEMFKICDFKLNSVINIKMLLSIIHKEDRANLIQLLKKSYRNNTHGHIVHKIVTKKQKTRYIENRWYNKYDSQNNYIKTIGIALDITHSQQLENENKQKESIMFQQSKMASMGEMLENIAHQWRQPLSVISTSASGMKMKKEYDMLEDGDIVRFTDIIVNTTEHMSKTIDDFRNFFKKNKHKEKLNLKTNLEKTLSLLESKFKNRNIEIIKNLQDVHIVGLDGELMQSFMNIFSNAQDALCESKNENHYLFISTYIEDNFAVVEIKDTAGGIALDKIDHIFEPYFTTKHKSNGTGIGLYMTYEIITKHHKGSIKVENSSFHYDNVPYKGALFTVKLQLKK